MALKFANKTKLALYVFLSLFCACGGNIVIAYVTKEVLNRAQARQGKIEDLYLIAIIRAAALIFLMLLDFLYRYLRQDLIFDFLAN